MPVKKIGDFILIFFLIVQSSYFAVTEIILNV